MEMALEMLGIFIIGGAVIVGLYFLAIGTLVKGLRNFNRYAKQWRSEDEVRVNVMKSLGQISDGLANFLLFLMIVPPIIAVIVALMS